MRRPRKPPAERTSEEVQERRAVRALTCATSCGIVTWHIFFGNFLSLFVDRVGFSPFLIGTLFLAIQLPTITQIAAARYVDVHGGKRLAVLLYGFGPISLFLLLLAPQAGDRLGAWTLTAGVFAGLFAFSLCNNIAAAGWIPLLRHNLPEGRRIELFGRLNAVGTLSGMAVLLACGTFVRTHNDVWRYQAIFLIAALIAAARAAFVRPLTDVDRIAPEARRPLWNDLRGVWENLLFRRLILFICLTYFGAGIMLPFRPLYVKALGYSEYFAFVATVPWVLAAYAIPARGWGRLADRFGSRSVYGLAGAGVVAAWLLLASVRGHGAIERVLVLAALGMQVAFWGGLDAGNFYRLFAVVPAENQSLYMSFYTIATAGALSVGSFAGGAIVALTRRWAPGWRDIPGMDYRMTFFTAAFLMLLGILYSHRMKNLEERSTPDLIMHLRWRTQRMLTLGAAEAFIRLRGRPPR